MKRESITVPFVRGLDVGAADPQLTAGLLRAENCIVDREGAVDKRYGKTALNGTFAAHSAMGSGDDRLVLVGDTLQVAGSCELYFESTGTSTQRCVVTDEPLLADANNFTHNPDMAIYNDLVYVGRTKIITSGSSYQAAFDALSRASGVKLQSTYTVTSSAANTKVVYVSAQNRIYAFYVDASNQLSCFAVDADGARGTTRNFVTSDSWPALDAAVKFDVVQVSATTIMVVYKQASADTFVVGVVTVSGDSINGTVGTRSETSQTNLKAVACCRWATSQAMVVYYREDAPRILVSAVYADNGSPLTKVEADVNIDSFADEFVTQVAVVATTAGASAICYWNRAASSVGLNDQLRRSIYTQSTNSWATDTIVGGNCSIWGKPVYSSTIGSAYLPIHHTLAVRDGTSDVLTASAQRSYFILRDTGGTWPIPIAHWWPDEADEMSATATRVGAPATVVEDGTDTWSLIGRRVGQDRNGDGVPDRCALAIVKFDVTPASAPRCVYTPAGMVIPGAVPIVLSGGDVPELTPLCYPELVTASPTGSGGAWVTAGLTAGLYGYRVAYEFFDGAGNRYISAMSPVATATTVAGSDSVTLVIPSLKITRLDTGNVRCVVFRSSDAASTVYKRIGSVANDPDAATVTFSDTALPTSHSEAEVEYTANNTKSNNWPCPPMEVVGVWQNRLFFADPGYPDRMIRYSKEFAEGLGIEFDVGLFFRCPPDGGDITALEPLGDRLVIFKRRRILATAGVGLDLELSGPGYADPQLVASDIGCTSQSTVVNTPVGIMFNTDAGIHLLGPDMSLVPIGREVKYHTDTYTIARGVCDPARNNVVFVTDGPALVYNYVHKTWTTWVNYASTDAAMAGGILYTKESSTNKVWKQDTTVRQDNTSTAVPMAVETGWIAPAGPDGFCRIWDCRLLGHNASDRTLTVKVAYDFDPTWVDTLTLDLTSLDAFAHTVQYAPTSGYTDDSLLIAFQGSRTKCCSIRFRIEDSAAVNGQLALSAVGFDFLPLGRKRPVGAARVMA